MAALPCDPLWLIANKGRNLKLRFIPDFIVKCYASVMQAPQAHRMWSLCLILFKNDLLLGMTCISFYFRSANITYKHFVFTTHTLYLYIHLSIHSVLQDLPFHCSPRCDQEQTTGFSITKAILKLRNWKEKKLSESETSVVSATISFPRN